MPLNDFDHLAKIYLNRVYNQVGFDEYVKNNEGYKFDFVNHFQNNFDIEASDIVTMLDKALLNNNLTGGNYFFPKKMLLTFAEKDGERIRQALKDLFDLIPYTADRIDDFKQITDEMLDCENKDKEKKINSFIDLRFISLLLATKYPNSYYYMMSSLYQRVGKYLNIGFNYNSKSTDGKKYMALAHVADFVKDKIKEYPEVMKVREGFLDPNNRIPFPKMFADESYNWITQDFIFIVGKGLAGSKDPII